MVLRNTGALGAETLDELSLASPGGKLEKYGKEVTGSAGDLKYVLKEGKKIGEAYYLVEMATDGRTLTISAYDGDTQKTLELLVGGYDVWVTFRRNKLFL